MARNRRNRSEGTPPVQPAERLEDVEAIEARGAAETAEIGRKGGLVTAAHPGAGTRVARAGRERTGERAGWVNLKAALLAGLGAGVLLLVLEMLLVPVALGGGAWAPVRMMASVVFGESLITSAAPMGLGVVLVGLLVHFAVSLLFAVVLGMLVRWFDWGPAALFGAGFGLAMYMILFHATWTWLGWFAAGRTMSNILLHVTFGVTAALVYRALAGPPEPVPDYAQPVGEW